jgi:hypothetical protein
MLLTSQRSLAQMAFTIGVYAYNDPNEVIWSCPAVQSALAARMGSILDEEITLTVTLNDDYDKGVIDLTRGNIDVARFPNVDNYWVIHPGLDVGVADAWRDAMVDLRLEEIVPRILEDIGVSDLGGAAEVISDATLAAVEEQFGSCVEVVQRLSRSDRPKRERLLVTAPTVIYGHNTAFIQALAAAHKAGEPRLLNNMPATAAGKAAQAKECGCQ